MTDSAQPQRLYLLGHPIAHSKSPVMYNAVYGRAGLPWTYGLADCATEDEAQAFLDARDFLSVNVTTPYKPHAYRAATARAASAKLAQGANVLVRKGDALIAYNTDGQGCVAYLERMGVSFAGKRVTVCGTGPTALSIVHACATAGADVVLLLGRDKERARRVLEDFVSRFGLLATATVDLPAARPHHRSFRAAYERTTFKFGSYATSTKALSSSDLVINATPLGMRAGDPAPFDGGLLRPAQTVFDAVYGHGETTLVRSAKESGCTVYDGGGMLVAQAVATVGIVCDVTGWDVGLGEDELFDLMVDAAGFDVSAL